MPEFLERKLNGGHGWKISTELTNVATKEVHISLPVNGSSGDGAAVNTSIVCVSNVRVLLKVFVFSSSIEQRKSSYER